MKTKFRKLATPTALITFYWAFILLACLIFKNYFFVYATIIIIALLAFIPYKMRIDMLSDTSQYKGKSAKDIIRKELLPTLKYFLIFAGALMIVEVLFVPRISSLYNTIKDDFVQIRHEKVLDLKNLEIYINEAKQKSYVYYRMNGSNSREFLDTDNLILADDSEMAQRYGQFHKIDDYEVAFATYKNSIYTEGLFKVSNNGNTYLVKAYIPQENSLNLLKLSNFKKALILNFADGSSKDLYINTETNEIALVSDNIIITSEYVEVPYSKSDYFTYRYDIFNSQYYDPTLINDDITISLFGTYADISSDITRVSFYLEGNEDNTYSEAVEIIFDDFAYVFRTGLIDVSNLKNIIRAST